MKKIFAVLIYGYQKIKIKLQIYKNNFKIFVCEFVIFEHLYQPHNKYLIFTRSNFNLGMRNFLLSDHTVAVLLTSFCSDTNRLNQKN